MSSVKLDSILDKLVKSSPPGELKGVSQDLNTLLSNQANSSVINKSIENYINENASVFSSKLIASKYNKQENSTKYIDYIGKKAFNIDLSKQTAIDFEDIETSEIEYPTYFDKLNEKLMVYGEDHYPSSYAFTIIPKEQEEVHVIIIGQRLNNDNFYTGQWKSHYILKNGEISGNIKLDIHYYEDGNVRLSFDEPIESTKISKNESDIVNFINNSENQITIKIVENFNDLNQKYFKNLRRLLPVTKSKINWGNAIGNYRLGSDVVNKQ
ncbi:subunits of heterodimeric actin filament capping protein Capz [Hyphopichia burtonii NRRL Y-1933]|uniref:F-actin-capping protein subunit alpha n=1 Tax=Hyphopichia burtonii NRRL Y-1933 TaxID=984485 RepID=A0A1E4REL2_9ASCO|nr:subunits of heterodimeric actin filament capping protein Capz [Hyphopichia burtonii NRRL Y-1933]ODV65690.1 subunits of heterodimeric actin filament capping protein Capz [Hyphopichia burtonii NRRL Y-1933]